MAVFVKEMLPVINFHVPSTDGMVNVVSVGAVKLIEPEQITKEARLNDVNEFAANPSPLAPMNCNFETSKEVRA